MGKCHNVEDCAYAIADNVKRSPFKHREAIQLAHDMERNNTYTNALIAENERLRKQLDAIKEDGFCLSCKGCNAPINPDNIRWCTDWQWRGEVPQKEDTANDK